ncbi:MAG: DUF1553 domain-containing protein [Akkermansiaceae bacterium]|nr:DUF1553 domain-containing protein [Akkermansiaceae bacterium]
MSDPENLRRTVHARISRKELDGFLRQFDYPDANVHAAGRETTITPTQKLYFLNSPFVQARAAKIAEGFGEKDSQAGVEQLFRKILSRNPTAPERELALRYFEESSDDRDWAGFAQVLLSSNAFLYRD